MNVSHTFFDSAMRRYWESFAEGMHCGLNEVMPQVSRHFYIFHHIGDIDTPGTMLDDARLVYKIPLSDFQKDDYRAALLNHVRVCDSEPEFTYLPGGHSLLTDAHNRFNYALEDSQFSLGVSHTRIVHRILKRSSLSIAAMLLFCNDYWRECKEILFSGKCPYDDKWRRLWELERDVLYNVDSDQALLHVPLSHNGVWFCTLGAFVPSAQVEQSFLECLALSPAISAKMYRNVYSQRCRRETPALWDRWTCERISRVAITNELPFMHSVREGCAIAFSDSQHPPTPMDLLEHVPRSAIQFQNGPPKPIYMLGGRHKFRKRQGNNSDGELTLVEREFDDIVDQSSEFYVRLGAVRRSATTAMMSRNMSHNLGSHALANSKFFGSVGLLDEKSEGTFSKDEIQGARGRLRAFNQYCQGRLDFIARTLSEGGDKPEPMFFLSDVMQGFASQDVLLNTLLDDNGFRLGKIEFHFHGLEDSDGSKRREPVIWKHERVHPAGRQNPKAWAWELKKCPDAVRDVLLGIAGGPTGCHAMYALIENLLRNAAKYSNRQYRDNTVLELHIAISNWVSESGTEFYKLDLWENLSDDDRDKVTAKVRYRIHQDVIDDEGKPNQGGQGVQEMKLCARYLAGGQSFESDEDLLGQPPEDECVRYMKYAEELLGRAPAGAMKPETAERFFWPLRDHSLRAFASERGGRRVLVYEMLIPKPVLLGLVCVSGGAFDEACEPNHPCVKRYANLEKMARDSVHIGVIIAHDDKIETIRHTIREIALHERHTALPYRLLVVTHPGQAGKWSAVLSIAMADIGAKRFYPVVDCVEKVNEVVDRWGCEYDEATGTAKSTSREAILPCNRVHVIDGPLRHGSDDVPWLTCCQNASKLVESISTDDWEDVILAVYDSWLHAWKGTPRDGERWSVLIGFERNYGYASRWMTPLEEYSRRRFHRGSRFPALYVGVKPETATETELMFANEAEFLAPSRFSVGNLDDVLPPRDRCCVFDNHGSDVFGALSNDTAIRMYHQMGGGQLTLFQMLDAPPTSPFGFSFFALSLLEGCLLRVATLDERVAEATIGTADDPTKLDLASDVKSTRLYPLRRSGIYPLFSFSRQTMFDENFINETIADRLITRNLGLWFSGLLISGFPLEKENVRRWICCEGIRFGDDPPIAPLGEMTKDGVSELNGVDTIVIHEGILDSLHDRGLWQRGDHRRLFSIVPAVVRTSGRGRQSRYLGDDLPFVELNVLSDSCYGSMNKIKLARAVINASGDV